MWRKSSFKGNLWYMRNNRNIDPTFLEKETFTQRS